MKKWFKAFALLFVISAIIDVVFLLAGYPRQPLNSEYVRGALGMAICALIMARVVGLGEEGRG